MINNKNILSTEELLEEVRNYAVEQNISSIVLFAKSTENVLNLSKLLKKTDISLYVTTFPANEPIFIRNEDDEVEEIYPEILKEENKLLLEENNITLVSSTMPLDPIVIPGTNNNPYEVITQTLNLFGSGVGLCVQSAMMLTDTGYLEPNQRVLSVNSKLAIDLTTCNSRYLFHPEFGLEIYQLIK